MDLEITRELLREKLLLGCTSEPKHCLEDEVLFENLIEILLHEVELVFTQALQELVDFLVYYDQLRARQEGLLSVNFVINGHHAVFFAFLCITRISHHQQAIEIRIEQLQVFSHY